MSRLGILLSYSKSFVGIPYIWGGNHPREGYDCSGFVQEVLASVGLDPKGDQTAQTLYDHFEQMIQEVTASGKFVEKPQAGCILFFGASMKDITHVAIAIDELHMIEAGGGGSKTLTIKDAVKQGAFVRVRPISNRKDLMACLLPLY